MTAEPVTGTAPHQDRLLVAVPRAAEVLHDLARELRLTNDELMAVLTFFGEVAREDELILLSDVLGLSRVVDDQTHEMSAATPSNVLGPFYRPGAPWIDDEGSLVPEGAAGERIQMTGTVRDASSGSPIAGAVIDVWHADDRGLYSNEDSAGDPWALRGRQRVDADGRYQFETVRPKHYTVKHDGPVGRLLTALGRHPWRPAHIHFVVTAPGYRPLVTQVYLAGGPYLDDDTITGVKDELITPVEDGRLTFDIALAPQPA